MSFTLTPSPSALAGKWVWLFPATYLVHLGEEFCGGEGFYRWLVQFAGNGLTAGQFLTINAAFMSIMIASMLLILRAPAWRWLLCGYGALVMINGMLHGIGTLITATYSPGLVSGMLLWVPLGVYTLRRCRRALPPEMFWFGLSAGIAMHAAVSLIALTIG
ncbi:MAG: HXXEE domain-containing protein [candidate division KSB1 bacterium]|nr:HXXEE domain-containing protein [candidate division KSB1 bacterium]MDZ7275887.1 HXXEE domain-containing protein [candidate division KSB1 bacterium]MDZ7287637.1 HXXEE domain-containing protein [candidate division KSB1 bacterium]MDZ7306799.1 HXXEE domain-containing protein [candidate division KSB1 bacterium]MDZ7350615.1 HXXEE domain-containing protein [candidate division KSB1 bacterium]